MPEPVLLVHQAGQDQFVRCGRGDIPAVGKGRAHFSGGLVLVGEKQRGQRVLANQRGFLGHQLLHQRRIQHGALRRGPENEVGQLLRIRLSDAGADRVGPRELAIHILQGLGKRRLRRRGGGLHGGEREEAELGGQRRGRYR